MCNTLYSYCLPAMYPYYLQHYLQSNYYNKDSRHLVLSICILRSLFCLKFIVGRKREEMDWWV